MKALRPVPASLGIFLASLAAAGCSAPPGAGDDGPVVPAYSGGQSSGAQSPAPASSSNPNSSANSPTGAVGGSRPEGTNTNAPIANGAAGSGSSNVGGVNASSGGAGGAPATPAAGGAGGAPATGAAGAPPVGAAGSASTGAAGGTSLPPPPPPAGNPLPAAGSGCGGSAFFCEDFETFAAGTPAANAKWRPEGTLSIDGTMAKGGTRSLHLQPNGGQNARIVLSSFAPPGNSFYGRMNVFVQQFPTAPAYSHFVLVEATGSSGEHVRPIGGQFIPEGNGPSTYWGVGSDQGATGDWTKWEPRIPTQDARWLCMEWRMNAADSSVRVLIDGTEQTALAVSSTNHGGNGTFNFPTFNGIWLGWWNFQAGTTPAQFNVWLDDIVLSTDRVGCN